MKIIVFHSYKGGTGKTTIALNVALEIAQRGYRTLLIDADLNAPTFDSIFLNLKPTYCFNELFEKKEENEDNVTFQQDNFPLVKDLPINSGVEKNLDLVFADPTPKFGQGLLSMDKNFHAKVLKKLFEIKKECEKLGYDYLIMDTSPSLNLSSVNAIIVADAVVIILRPNRYGISGTSFLLKELYSMLGVVKRKDFIIFNQIVPKTPEKMIEEWEKYFKKNFNIDTIGIIYCQCDIALNMLQGKFAPKELVNTDFSKVINKISNNLLKELK